VKPTLLIWFFSFFNFLSEAQQQYLPLRITKVITLDGQLKEAAWSQATVVSGFMQDEPNAGKEPSERTECRFLYDNDYLYLGVKVYDSEPEKVVANSMERDFEPGYDDGITLVLDTYHDKRTGLVFVATPLGARYDEEINEDGNYENPSFNTFWDAAAHRDSTGYEMEFRIPFFSLRFKQADTVIMGYKLVRAIQRKSEYDVYPKSDPSIVNVWDKVSLAEEIIFTNLKSKKPFYVAPYLIANYSEKNELNGLGTKYNKSINWLNAKNFASNRSIDKILSNLGADLKYGVTKNFTLDLSLNTDFAQVEADNYIVNLTKFDINLPEKRKFFLESQSYLEFPINSSFSIFNTRSIGIEEGSLVPIPGGARLTGKANGWSVGLLDMQTKEVTEQSIAAHNFSVVRLRKDAGAKGSYFGAVITNKISTTDRSISNQVAGLDYFHRLNEVWYGRLQMAGSFDKKEKVNAGNFEGGFYITQDKKVGLANSVSMEAIGQHFNPAMGFLAENNIADVSLHDSYIWDISKHGKTKYFTVSNSAMFKWLLKQGTDETFAETPSLNLSFKEGANMNLSTPFVTDHVIESWQLSEDIAIPIGSYKMNAIELMANSNTNHQYNYSFDIKFGRFYGGNLWLFNPFLHLIVRKHFNVDLSYQFTRIQFPVAYSQSYDPVYISHLISGRLSLFFSSKLNVKLLTQYDYQNRQWGTNLRLLYNPREGTDLYFVVNENLNTDINSKYFTVPPPALNNQSVIIKFVKTFEL
jgi:hypothetical protein